MADNAIVLADNAIVPANNAIVSANNAIVLADNAIVSADNVIVSANNAIYSPSLGCHCSIMATISEIRLAPHQTKLSFLSGFWLIPPFYSVMW
ncbi:hypothetical protein [Nostoc sp. FACHB-888]|uniref:hypothetical protein n=1 Tax=Nostoc sp. FACHB-888 TaxID=2692842 RepID=UPI001683D2C2|nr:hypothetical protein [Nostoc sp. FACHB-888]MBD2247288.1 hypothetical protein [Nostoc sp. FACHB-888]